MATWILVLIIAGNAEHKVGEYESMTSCSKAGLSILTAATEAYGALSPNLHFRCSKAE